MKYVYAVLTVIDNNPIMQTLLHESRLNGRQVLERVVMTAEERARYREWDDENDILKDMSKTQPIRVEIQEVEII